MFLKSGPLFELIKVLVQVFNGGKPILINQVIKIK